VITTTSFSNVESPLTVQNTITRLIERDSQGRHRPRTVSTLLSQLDENADDVGFTTMYGIHGIDDNPRLHPYMNAETMGDRCTRNTNCGENGNLCVSMGTHGRTCTAACTDDSGCPRGWACRQVASPSSHAIYGRACVLR
jgi:hypothetical protein